MELPDGRNGGRQNHPMALPGDCRRTLEEGPFSPIECCQPDGKGSPIGTGTKVQDAGCEHP